MCGGGVARYYNCTLKTTNHVLSKNYLVHDLLFSMCPIRSTVIGHTLVDHERIYIIFPAIVYSV